MAKKLVNLESKTVTFDVDGNTEVFQLDNVSDEMLIQLALHGASQKIGDSYAGAQAATKDSNMSVADYVLTQVQGGIQQLYSGDWSIRTGGGAGPRVTDLARALAEAYNVDEAEAAEKVAEMDSDTKKAVRKHPAIAPILDRIRAERAAAKAAESEAASGEAELPDLF
jgi:molybdenum-dependent DNA-binding transcriptional regulator ModE